MRRPWNCDSATSPLRFHFFSSQVCWPTDLAVNNRLRSSSVVFHFHFPFLWWHNLFWQRKSLDGRPWSSPIHSSTLIGSVNATEPRKRSRHPSANCTTNPGFVSSQAEEISTHVLASLRNSLENVFDLCLLHTTISMWIQWHNLESRLDPVWHPSGY